MIVKKDNENIVHYISHFFHNGNIETICEELIINNQYVIIKDACWGSKNLCKKCKKAVIKDLKGVDDGKGKMESTI